jgi:hypothetical protein
MEAAILVTGKVAHDKPLHARCETHAREGRRLGVMIGWKALPLVLLIGVASACAPKSKLNHVIVPTGYRGLIAFASDPHFASESYKDGELYVHKVPRSGIVCVESDETFRPLFRVSAEFSDGTEIFSNFTGLSIPPGPDSIRIEALGSWGSSSEDGYLHWFGVGTEADLRALKAQVLGGHNDIMLGPPQNARIRRGNNPDFFHLKPYCAKH